MCVGLRVDVTDFVALRETVEITQLAQSFATVSCQSIAKSVAETSRIVVGGVVSLSLNSAQSRIESHVVEQPAVQFDRKFAVFLI